MGLLFELGKPKPLELQVEVMGIDQNKLKYNFVVITPLCEYGFPCKQNLDKLTVEIPPLEKVCKDIKSGDYSVRLDVFGENYYMCPLQESAKVVTPVKVDVKMTSDPKSVSEAKVKVQMKEPTPVSKPKEKVLEEKVEEKKPSKFASKFANWKKPEEE